MPAGSAVVAALMASGALALAVIVPSSSPPPASALSVVPVTSGPARSLGDSVLAPATATPRARYIWPLAPAPHVLRRFALGPTPWSPGHRGVDLAASAGQAVLAAGPGVVTFAGRIAGVAAVSVTHRDGLRTTYQPVSPQVRPGDQVTAGRPLGRLDQWPGHCPGPCLHWGALRGRTYLDPLALLGLVPPVLLPVAGGPSP
jgi:murein DD-endopeptidase MepM/ murein hydrolase activator NlpD